MKKTGFDNELYVKSQIETIKERIKMFDNKLYLEFGGKLFDDHHAKRVLPGFKLDSKIRLLEELKDQCEIIFCINAKDIEKKIRADYGISYDMEVMRLVEIFRKLGITVNSVVITLYKGQSTALRFKEKLENIGVKTYFHTFTKGYPTDVDVIVSEEGYGANPYIETTKPLVIVNAPGPCSGKLATCLSQLYHEHKRGIKAGYAKFETFPVWNLPLKHPVNVAYEAATADLADVNMIDTFHLEAYKNKEDVIFEKSSRLYWEDSDYLSSSISSGFGPGKWFHSPGPYNEYRRQYECVFFYVDGLYREQPVYEIEYEMNNAAFKYHDCSELYLCM